MTKQEHIKALEAKGFVETKTNNSSIILFHFPGTDIFAILLETDGEYISEIFRFDIESIKSEPKKSPGEIIDNVLDDIFGDFAMSLLK